MTQQSYISLYDYDGLKGSAQVQKKSGMTPTRKRKNAATIKDPPWAEHHHRRLDEVFQPLLNLAYQVAGPSEGVDPSLPHLRSSEGIKREKTGRSYSSNSTAPSGAAAPYLCCSKGEKIPKECMSEKEETDELSNRRILSLAIKTEESTLSLPLMKQGSGSSKQQKITSYFLSVAKMMEPPFCSGMVTPVSGAKMSALERDGLECVGYYKSPSKSMDVESRSADEEVETAVFRGSRGQVVPADRLVPSTTYVVDAFSYGYITNVTGYFLSHFHSDHYDGLRARFNKRLYCTRVTANLVELAIKVSSVYITVLELNQPMLLEDKTTVTALDANHCPGAAMFLFQLENGRVILHCGDMRAEDVVVKHSIWTAVHVDTLFLDTTYCQNKYRFPKQAQTIAAVIDCVRKHMAACDKLMVVVGTYKVGKEKLFKAIAEEFDWEIYVNAQKMRVLRCIGDNALSSRLTTHKEDAHLHVLSMALMSFEMLENYLHVTGTFDHVLGIIPTGWEYHPRGSRIVSTKKHNNVTIATVPYSEHSSFDELKAFVTLLRPRKIIPTVTFSDEAQNRKLMTTLSEWSMGIKLKNWAKGK